VSGGESNTKGQKQIIQLQTFRPAQLLTETSRETNARNEWLGVWNEAKMASVAIHEFQKKVIELTL